MIYTSTPISFGYNLHLSSGSIVLWLVNRNIQQARQRMYNVTMRRVHATTVAVEKQWVLHNLGVCISTFRYPACNVHAPYCHLWPAPLHNVFSHYLINGMMFGKKLLNTECVFWFTLQVLSETFLNLRRNAGDMIKNVYCTSCQVPISLVRF